MLTPEEFGDISKRVDDGEVLTNEETKSLLKTIYHMDVNSVIFQNCLQLAMDNARDVIPAVAEKVLSMSGRTDSKSKKKAATYAADVSARFEVALHMYLAEAAEKAFEMLEGMSDTETTEPAQEADNEETK